MKQERMCVRCKKQFIAYGKHRLCPECRHAKPEKRQYDYKSNYKAIKKITIKIYNNPCRGTERDPDTDLIRPCRRKTGKNRFFCARCFRHVDDTAMEQY